MTYFNTVGLEDIADRQAKTETQEALVLNLFKRYWNRTFSPSEVHRYVLPLAPLTSVRRSITNLTAAGVLIKTDERKDGLYGHPESAWRLAQPEQILLFGEQKP